MEDIKNYLITYNFQNKKRFGKKGDGGYVIGLLENNYDAYISCGIANEESFTKDFLNYYSYLNKNNSYAFDGTIKNYPWRYTKNIQFFKKNINTYNDDKNTNLNDIIDNYNNIFLNIDIEGSEFPWILSLKDDQLKKFKQICIELHGLNGNKLTNDKIKCLKKLSNTHYIIHAHGNNFDRMNNDIPNVLELTYINKDYFKTEPEKNFTTFPIKGLDYRNFFLRRDFKLDKYPFVFQK
jgi:hypothetical protein